MDYEKLIEKHRNIIDELEQKRDDEAKKRWPNVVGRYFNGSSKTFYKVLSIENYYEEDQQVLAECIVVFIDKNSAGITSHEDVRFYMSQEITEKRFNEAYVDALTTLSKILD